MHFDVTDPEGSLLAAVAGFGLPGCGRRLPVEPVDDRSWSRLVSLTGAHRIVGLLVAAVDAGAFPVTPGQVDVLRVRHRDVAACAVRLERDLHDALDVIAPTKSPVRVLKGPALAHTIYSDPCLREFGDIDLLVPSASIDPVLNALVQAGYRRAIPELRPGFDRRFGKGATLFSPRRFELDVHRTLTTGPFGLTVRPWQLFDTPTPFLLGGRRLLGLGADARFVHACIHVALTPRQRLSAVRDVAQLVLGDGFRLDDALALAEAWQARIVVARAIGHAVATFALDNASPAATWAARYEPTPDERRFLRVYERGGLSYTSRAAATMRLVPGIRDKLAYSRAVVFPDRAVLSARRSTRFGYLRRGVTHLRGRGVSP